MQIAIASGKGGTGKTTLATNLAFFLSQKEKVTLLDCDVEEPNAHIFIKPEWQEEYKAYVTIPEVDREKCTGCGICGEVCQFSAIAVVKEKVLTFPELCHGCKLCQRLCPEKALGEGQRELGTISIGSRDNITFIHGKMRVGEAMAPPLISEVKKHANQESIILIDSPPGTSCPAIEAVSGADFVLLVTEPTPFGLNDLRLAVEMVRTLGLPLGVAINRADLGDKGVWEYCKKENIPIILEIPNSKDAAKNYSQGKLILEEMPDFKESFATFWENIRKELRQ